MMNLKYIQLYQISMPLKHPFITHAGAVEDREVILMEAVDENGESGWGECVPFTTPFYTAETIDTAWTLLTDLLIPRILSVPVEHPEDIKRRLDLYKGNQMAKAGAEAAIWDLYARQQKMSLAKCIGGVRDKVDAGVVISLGEDLEERLEEYEAAGYKRYKLKVDKGKERHLLEKVLSINPKLPLMFDGNGMYGEKDMDHLVSLDDLGLQMIEQPFPPGDFVLHRQLQQRMQTPICLDESIESYHDAWQAIQLKSTEIINVKPGRVGGLTEALSIHTLCADDHIPLWCGGMLETGVGRAHNIALASLPQFTIPGDISASDRYYERDIITGKIEVTKGEVQVPEGCGTGVEMDREYVDFLTTRTLTLYKGD
ncbi:o-succinylbenzoate synthase [Virgibacillus sp. MSP4-1]|uniref:o-succinylbenzoate synthase n=1 Tax=Virgibacillus sp. MSP4-1 TaxID=2700081 RepID=UPI0003A0422D|nr:o-succinylbenzoate synthase [Virgibacillus sp. MSP4-1]QHS23100.1 o-succinylbenzoate synthase [Virgibacillus sp. MSP4-1]